MKEAFGAFLADVAARRFPSPEETYHITDEEFDALLRELRVKPRDWRLAI
jgi:hypothetical protein